MCRTRVIEYKLKNEGGCSNLVLVLFFLCYSWKDYPSAIELFLQLCQKSVGSTCVLFLGSQFFFFELSISLLISHCLDYCSYIVSLKNEQNDFHFILSQNYFIELAGLPALGRIRVVRTNIFALFPNLGGKHSVFHNLI